MAGMSIGSYSSLKNKSGIGGLASGLNTDELIEAMTSGTRAKITSTLQKKQQAIWKRDQYREISSKMTSFYNKYFSYTNAATNLLSSSFYNVATAKPSSEYVKVSGDISTAQNMIIKDIKSLASKTQFTSSHQVSSPQMQSGAIYGSWTDTSVAGQVLVVNMDGKEYTLTVSKDLYLDSASSEATNVQKVIDDLNKQINANADLKGKLEFSFAGGSVSLKQLSSTPSDTLKITSGGKDLLRGLGLTSSDTGATEITGAVKGVVFFEKNNLAGSSFALSVGGVSETLKIDDNFAFSAGALNTDASGKYTPEAKALQATELQTALNNALAGTALQDKVTMTVTGDDTGVLLKMVSADASEITISGGDSALLTGLGLSTTSVSNGGELISGVNTAALYSKADKTLSGSLAGKSITFNLNGIAKTISFNESEKDQYATIDGLASYLQNSLDKAFGAGRTFVTSANGKLSFSTYNASAPAGGDDGSGSILTLVSSSANGVLGENGALHLLPGESNRVEFSHTLDKVASELTTPLVPGSDGEYVISVNGKEFTFTKDNQFGDVISRINSDKEVGVTISYSSVSNTFHVTANETGKQGKIEIQDVSGNLATSLFGTVDERTVSLGTDMQASVSFDGGKSFTDIFRSSNAFTIDGMNIEVTGKADGAAEENITFTTQGNSDELYNKIKTFIDDYNEIVSWIQTKTNEKLYGRENDDDTEAYLPLTDEQKAEMTDKQIEQWEEKAKMGMLRNDHVLNKIALNMRHAMGDMIEGTGDALYQLGITTTSSYMDGGKLVIDETKLRAALTENPQKVKDIFSNRDTGIAYRMQNELKNAIVGDGKTDGILIQMAGKDNTLKADTSTMTMRIDNYSQMLTKLKSQLNAEESRYWKKFTYLETYISNMNSQQSYLEQMFAK